MWKTETSIQTPKTFCHKSYQLAPHKFAAVFEALDDIQHVDGPLDVDVVMEDEE